MPKENARPSPGSPSFLTQKPAKIATIQEAVEALAAWLPSETDDFKRLVASLLAALPGGEELEGVEAAPVGWKEVELLGDLLSTIQDAGDVRFAVRRLYAE